VPMPQRTCDNQPGEPCTNDRNARHQGVRNDSSDTMATAEARVRIRK
jgi:hypothetical protein